MIMIVFRVAMFLISAILFMVAIQNGNTDNFRDQGANTFFAWMFLILGLISLFIWRP